MKKLLIMLTVTLLVGCEYKPMKTYEVKTTTGETFTLLCPEIERDRSMFIYYIEHECRVIKEPRP